MKNPMCPPKNEVIGGAHKLLHNISDISYGLYISCIQRILNLLKIIRGHMGVYLGCLRALMAKQ